MQLKLIRFYKILSNFATSMISAFIPILIYVATDGNLSLAMLSIVVQKVVEIVFTYFLRHHIYNDPQLFLLLRIIPIILIQVFILLIDNYLIVSFIGLSFFTGLNYTFKNLPSECIQNYSSFGKSAKSTGVTRLIEQSGYVIATIAGGLFLDNLPKFILVTISMSLYVISVAPLFIYYIKNHHHKTFNKEAISNAFVVFEQTDSKKTRQYKQKVIRAYSIAYFLNYSFEAMFELINMYLFTMFGTFTSAGALSAIKEGAFGVGSYIASRIYQKNDLIVMSIISFIVNAIIWAILPFIADNLIFIFVLVGVNSLLYAFSSLMLYEKIIEKGRVMGISNKLLLNRYTSLNLSKTIPCTLCAIIGGFIPLFIYSSIGSVIASVYIPLNEENTRKIIVDCLENNNNDYTPIHSAKK